MDFQNSLVRALSKKRSFKGNSTHSEKLRSFKRILPTVPQPVSIMYSVTTAYSTQDNYDENIVKYSTDVYEKGVTDMITRNDFIPRIPNIQTNCNGRDIKDRNRTAQTYHRKGILSQHERSICRETEELCVGSNSTTTLPQRMHSSTSQYNSGSNSDTRPVLSNVDHALHTLCPCFLNFNLFKAGKRSKHRVIKSIRNSFSRSSKGQFTVNEAITSSNILYLGNVATILSKGEGSTEFAIKRVLQSSRQGKVGIAMEMMINDKYLSLTCKQLVIRNQNLNADDFTECKYNLRRITNCSTSSSNPRILAWTYRHETHHKRIQLSCHVAILKSKTATGGTKALELNKAVERAHVEHHRENKSKLRHRKKTLSSRDTLLGDGNYFLQNSYLDELESPVEHRELFTITEQELS